jgi:hypothetical protein
MGAKKPRAHLARGEIGTPGGRMARLSTYERDNCGDKKGRPSGGPNRSTGDVTRSLGINSVSNINEKSALPARAREHAYEALGRNRVRPGSHSLREPTIACRRPGPERRTGAFSFPAVRAPQLDEIAKAQSARNRPKAIMARAACLMVLW